MEDKPLSPQPTSSEANPSAKKRRKAIVVAIVGVLVVLAGAIIGSIILLRRSSDGPSSATQSGDLTLSSEEQRLLAEEWETPDAPVAETDIAPVYEKNNIGVTVAYKRQPSLSLTVENVEKTASRDTTRDYLPYGDEPYSILRLENSTGEKLAETRFSVSTETIVEDTAGGVATATLDESSAYLVFAGVEGQPAKAVITAADGRVMSEKTFGLAITNSPDSDPALGKKVISVLAGLFKTKFAKAQGAYPDLYLTATQTSGCFRGAGDSINATITVINNSRSNTTFENVVVTMNTQTGAPPLSSATPTADPGSQYTWSLGSLEAGKSREIRLTFLALPTTFNTRIPISVSASNQTSYTGQLSLTRCATSTPPPDTGLKARVIGSPCFQYPGTTEFTYQVEVVNESSSNTYNAPTIYFQPFTTNARLISTDPAAIEPGGTRAIWRVPSMVPGDRVQFNVTLAPRNQTTPIHVVFYASPTNSNDAQGNHDIPVCGSSPTPSGSPSPTPDPENLVKVELKRTNEDDQCFILNDEFEYTATVTNESEIDLTDVQVRFIYGNDATFDSADPPPDEESPDQHQISWLIAQLPAGESVEYNIKVKTGEVFLPMSARLEAEYTNPETNEVETSVATLNISPCQPEGFIIAVTNEVGAENRLDSAAATIVQMKNSLDPWKKYRNKIFVIKVPNSTDLKSQLLTTVGGQVYPRASQDALIINTVATTLPNWDSIVVVHPHDCDCGTVATNFPPITTFGSRFQTNLAAHELGHSVGKLTDEYLYQFGSTTGISGPNCFSGEEQCRAGTSQYPDAQCSLGCNRVNTWRPSTGIMHNTYSPLTYGPLESCVLENGIRAAIGQSPNGCEDDLFYAVEPEVGIPPQPGEPARNYWGIGR